MRLLALFILLTYKRIIPFLIILKLILFPKDILHTRENRVEGGEVDVGESTGTPVNNDDVNVSGAEESWKKKNIQVTTTMDIIQRIGHQRGHLG